MAISYHCSYERAADFESWSRLLQQSSCFHHTHDWFFFFISTNPCPGNSDHMRVSPYGNLCKHLLKHPQWDSYPLLNWKLKAYKMPLSFALMSGIWFVARVWISLMHVWPENDGMFFPWVNVREQSLPETNVGGTKREASYLCSSFALLRDSPPQQCGGWPLCKSLSSTNPQEFPLWAVKSSHRE